MTTAADVLGVDESATKDEIQSAFNQQVRRFHPDQFNPDRVDIDDIDDVDPDGLFRDVKQARDTLTGAASEVLSLEYEWEDGEPQYSERSSESEDSESEQVAESETSEDGDQSQTGEPSGAGAGAGDDRSSPNSESSETPWSSEGRTDDSGIDDTISVNIDDGPEESGSIGGNQTGSIVSRRNLLAVIGTGGAGLIAANWLGAFDSTPGDNFNSGRTTEYATVGPSETIQDAADRVMSGGTLEIPSGTYNQRFSIDVDMSVIAPDRATLLGGGADATAIIVSDVDAEIEGLTIAGYDDGGIHGGGSDSDISISNVTVEDLGSTGIDLTGEQIELDNVTARQNGGTGVNLGSTGSGTVTVTNATVTANSNELLAGDSVNGIEITGGTEVTVQDSEVTNSKDHNVIVEPGSARGQSVTVENTLVASANNEGVRIEGSNGDSTVVVRGVESDANSSSGIAIGDVNAVNSATIEDVVVQDNSDTGVQLTSTGSGTVTVTNATVTANSNELLAGDSVNGIEITGGTEVTVQDSEVTNNKDHNVIVEPGSARDQSVTVTSTLAAGANYRDGVRIVGSDSEDSLTIESVDSKNNADYGFDLGGEAIRIIDSTAPGNGEGDLRLRDIDRDQAEIVNSL